MKRTILSLIVASSVALPVLSMTSTTAISNASLDNVIEKSPYYEGKHADKVSPYNGAIISDAMYESVIAPDEELGTYRPNAVTYDEVAEGVHSFNMGGIVNVHVIETDNGIVVYDTGDHNEEGTHFYHEIRKVTDKPILAIMYSHEHYAGGSSVFVNEEAKRGNKNIKIIGHHGHNASISKSLAGVALHKEVSDVLMARTMNQFYSFAQPEGHVGCGHTHKIDLTLSRSYEEVNTPITKNGQKMTIDGKEFVFYIDGITTDTSQQLLAYMPEKKVAMNNIMWGFYPNLYSIRGGAYRNPEVWIGALDILQDIEIDILLSTHSKSVSLKNTDVKEHIEIYQDGMTATLNQTLKGILKGKKPTEIAYDVSIPEPIANAPLLRQDYGEIANMVPQIYSAVLGTFNAEAADIIPMHPAAEADLMVRLAGGTDKALSFAKKEHEKGNFLNAVQLGKHLYELAPENQEYTDFYIKALHSMASSTESHNSRSWYLTRAEILEGNVTLPSVIPQVPESIVRDVADFVDSYRIRINHQKAGDTRALIGFEFENGVKKGLEIRNGVSYSRDDISNADVTIKMNEATFTKVYNNMATIGQLVEAGEASVEGSVARADELMGMYDVVYDWQNDKGLQFLIELTKEMAADAVKY